MGCKSITEVFDRGYYISKIFKYKGIWQYHREEPRILADIESIQLSNIDFSGRAAVIFKCNLRSKVITHSLMEWIMTQINARLVLQTEIVWCGVDVPSLKRHELQININIPAKSL